MLKDNKFSLEAKNNPNIIPDNKANENKKERHGLKRAIVDFIQWLGDHNFEDVLEGYKRKVYI